MLVVNDSWYFLKFIILGPPLPRGRHDRVEAVPGGSSRVREGLQERRQRLPIGRSVRHQQVPLGARQRRRRAHCRGILYFD